MKISTLFLFIALLPISANTLSQTINFNQEFNGSSFSEFMQFVEEKTDYKFFLSNSEVNVNQNVINPIGTQSVKDAVDMVLEDLGLQYKITEEKLILIVGETEMQQQSKTITGTIKDETGESLPGVTVVIKGTNNGTITDADGNFSIANVSAGNVLVFSFVGMQTQEIVITNQSTISITMIPDAIGLEEVVAIGYGVQKKDDATGAVDVVTSESFNQGMTTSPTELLSGKTAGVQITQSSGAPGAGSSVRIRGINSITGSSEPLYVIDGVPVDNNRSSVSTDQTDNATTSVTVDPLSTISPSDIESITVLKDASATAIYGSRGANGVIIVTTKKGKEGRVSLSYNGTVGVSSVANTIDLYDADGYITAVENLASQVPVGNDPKNYHGYTGAGADTDWQDEVFRTAVTHKHDVSFSGGVEKFNYRFSAGYYNQEGVVEDTDYERLTARFNATQKMFDDKLKFDVSLSVTDYDVNNLPEQQTGGYLGGVLNNALKMDPTQPVYAADGSLTSIRRTYVTRLPC